MNNKVTNEEMYDSETGNLISKYCQNPACPKFYDKVENEKGKFCPYCGKKYPTVVNSSNDVKTPRWKILSYMSNHPVICSLIIASISLVICLICFYQSSIIDFYNNNIVKFIKYLSYHHIITSLIVAIIVLGISYFILHKLSKSTKKQNNSNSDKNETSI